MSSSPRSDPGGRLRSWLAGRSLRTRLVAAVVALLALVSIAIGGLTTVALRQFLIAQVDNQLTADDRRQQELPPWFRPFAERQRADDQRAPEPPPGFPPASIAAKVVDGGVASARIRSSSGPTEALPAADVSALPRIPTDGRPRSVDLGGRGDYRAVARQAPDGDVLVFAIPLAGVQETVWWMIAAQAGVAAAGLLVAGALGALIVRATLRPLNRVAATAARVTELPLDRGEVALSVRVPESDTDPRTEVGQVGAALNRMLGHVAAALAARQASETRVRQFVADASHELRTPLAAIRGYAEVA
ncbi:histidine kinase dimerization/phospho-acceptor domain-containing protein, partial [Micromonospora purpureochromogenes]|uniref:histidine kinase dimerization/phospho-acceptor domain-containing protein n=1 Tax=Micromonospora purpureochromogenes TaxID=47872 RepID=UPI003324329E